WRPREHVLLKLTALPKKKKGSGWRRKNENARSWLHDKTRSGRKERRKRLRPRQQQPVRRRRREDWICRLMRPTIISWILVQLFSLNANVQIPSLPIRRFLQTTTPWVKNLLLNWPTKAARAPRVWYGNEQLSWLKTLKSLCLR